MKQVIGIILVAAAFSGCYTQIQTLKVDNSSDGPYVPPPIVIIDYVPLPSPPPPCPPHPHPPVPIITTPPTGTVPAPAPQPPRIRTEGSTRGGTDRTNTRVRTGSSGR